MAKIKLRVETILILLIVSTAAFARENQKAILAGNMVDVHGGKLRKNVLIVIEKDKVVKITSADQKSKIYSLPHDRLKVILRKHNRLIEK